jgi:DNA-binding HxlR family transcriptional regulator
MTPPRSYYRGTPLWRAVAAIVTELQATGEVKLETAPDYVIEHICRELVAKRLVGEAALEIARGD